MFGKRICLECGRPGLKVSTISTPVALTCEYCGTTHAVARFRNVPYWVAGMLLLLLPITWFAGIFRREVFVVLFGLWLVFDTLWGRFVPLQKAVDDQDKIEG